MTRKGFTLVELMVVVGILSIIMLVISQPVASVIKYQRESQTTDSLRDNLQFVINKMEKELKTSSNVYVNDAGELKFKDQNGGFVTYSFDRTNNVMKRNGNAFTDASIFKVERLNFIVTDKKDNLAKLVTVSIDAKSLDEKDSVSIQTSVLPVNDKPIIRDRLIVHVDAGNTESYPGTGTTWFDLSGNNKNLTLSGAPSSSKNDSGYIQFDGVNDFATLLNTGLSTGNTPHTIDMWVNIDRSIDNTQRWWLLQLGNFSPGNHHWIRYQFGTWGRFDGGIQFDYDHINDQEKWIHLVSTYDEASVLKFYVNNSKCIPRPAITCYPDGKQAKFDLQGRNVPLYIGKKWDRADTDTENYQEIYFKGKISNVRLYNRALSESEVEYNYNVTKGRFGIQ
jgi:prepilin-type N-terminal cleavage/methylation domain-containing protein